MPRGDVRRGAARRVDVGVGKLSRRSAVGCSRAGNVAGRRQQYAEVSPWPPVLAPGARWRWQRHRRRAHPARRRCVRAGGQGRVRAGIRMTGVIAASYALRDWSRSPRFESRSASVTNARGLTSEWPTMTPTSNVVRAPRPDQRTSLARGTLLRRGSRPAVDLRYADLCGLSTRLHDSDGDPGLELLCSGQGAHTIRGLSTCIVSVKQVELTRCRRRDLHGGRDGHGASSMEPYPPFPAACEACSAGRALSRKAVTRGSLQPPR